MASLINGLITGYKTVKGIHDAVAGTVNGVKDVVNGVRAIHGAIHPQNKAVYSAAGAKHEKRPYESARMTADRRMAPRQLRGTPYPAASYPRSRLQTSGTSRPLLRTQPIAA